MTIGGVLRGETKGAAHPPATRPRTLPPRLEARFPRLDARNLNGRRFRLPDDLEGEINVLLVGFEIRHQAPMDSWLPAIEALAASRPGLRVYELVPVARALLPARPVIDGGMVAGIPDPAARARTLTAYTDLGAFIAALGLPDARDIALFLVERGGRIRWGGWGGYDPGLAGELAEAMAEDGPPLPPDG